MKRKKKMEKTRDDLFEKEINLQDVLDNYRQALENRTLYNTLRVSLSDRQASKKSARWYNFERPLRKIVQPF